jgi:hypothetical protein
MRRYLPYIAAVVLLGGLNLWRWQAPLAKRLDGSAVQGRFDPADYRLRATSTAAVADVKARDLFYGPAAAPPARVAAVKVRPVTPEPPRKTPEELAEEDAQRELALIRVTAIAFRGGKGQAFVTAGADSFVVKPGDRIGERFDVVDITPDYVSVRDPGTSVGAKVPLQGE